MTEPFGLRSTVGARKEVRHAEASYAERRQRRRRLSQVSEREPERLSFAFRPFSANNRAASAVSRFASARAPAAASTSASAACVRARSRSASVSDEIATASRARLSASSCRPSRANSRARCDRRRNWTRTSERMTAPQRFGQSARPPRRDRDRATAHRVGWPAYWRKHGRPRRREPRSSRGRCGRPPRDFPIVRSTSTARGARIVSSAKR